MGGHSGRAVAPHTPIVKVSSACFALTIAQMRIVKRAKLQGGVTHVEGHEVRSTRTLVSLGVGVLVDDGPFGRNRKTSNEDGGRWVFTLAEGVEV